MANFEIYHDGKENPQGPFKEKGATGLGLGKSNVNLRIGGGTKVAFRDVGNVKQKDEADAGKKHNFVPVVDQFKNFTVFEDPKDIEQPKQIRSNVNVKQQANVGGIVVDKENIRHEKAVPGKIAAAIHKEFGAGDEYDYVLNTTPMSVSEVLSPMSVDNSMILQNSIDDNNSKEIVNQSKQKLRNDRERFYDIPEYQLDILEYFRESELKHRAKPHYMKRQTDINHSMRTILVDWLVEVSEEYNLDTETLYLSVSYIDRFLSQMSVVRSKLQLVGTAAMYIAAKYEEIYPPDVSEFVFITDDTYNKAQVLRMEQIILKILAFDLCTPTTNVYLNTYFVLNETTEQVNMLAKYICELSLLEADPYLKYYPSQVSAASLGLARYILDYPMWSSELEVVTKYSLVDLKEIILNLCKSHKAAATLSQQAIQEKYKSAKYKQVSTIAPVELSEEDFDTIVKTYYASDLDDTSMEEETTGNPVLADSANIRKMISSLMYK
ncbi:G2/mitotic-specific cyclin-A [Teleopsis dalmanni]|uniref:G2/mitotic-specific cyclin-A n=1 Tax=Teleopsis dalmanni TaxID=139649 RepID=UPI0018CFE0C5|nr:G2/mitotic-specific cyclin-A [Teleopsis dalmanni]XP_037933480.1 G2/mitotic-specific cyclin-A [Teleopsis dalmanni]XP_037933481.1 G2/mitotic-specific cyclin-A [Teleopsis dalmanni]XP_037933482.1 G2/mitotic-specific cyclin-A [Teleopsis dalmanni]